MKIAIILTGISILCIFGIAVFYPMFRKRLEQKKLQAWRDELEKDSRAQTISGIPCQILTTPDINGDCNVLVKIGLYWERKYMNIDKLYPLEGGENGKGS